MPPEPRWRAAPTSASHTVRQFIKHHSGCQDTVKQTLCTRHTAAQVVLSSPVPASACSPPAPSLGSFSRTNSSIFLYYSFYIYLLRGIEVWAVWLSAFCHAPFQVELAQNRKSASVRGYCNLRPARPPDRQISNERVAFVRSCCFFNVGDAAARCASSSGLPPPPPRRRLPRPGGQQRPGDRAATIN